MKVLFLGHYREFGGWSRAAMDYILAMDAAGIEVVCRNVPLTPMDRTEIPDRIIELEGGDIDNCDVCIQNLLPHHLIGSRGFKKNVALFFSESYSIKPTQWFVQLQQMDEVWVPNAEMKAIFTSDGLMDEDKIKLFPCPSDLKAFSKKYEKASLPEIDHKFKFYYVGDLNDRKNLESLVRSFHSEFDRSEPVALILKVWKFGLTPQQTYEHMKSICDKVKGGLKMYQSLEAYHEEVILSDQISDDKIKALHIYADCFVCPSHGEAWSIPSFDAMCFGNTPVCSSVGGPVDFIGEDVNAGFLLSGSTKVCVCSDSPFVQLFTGREEWFDPSEKDLKSAMRYYYKNRDQIDRTAGLKRAQSFSYEAVGQQIKEHLGA